MPRRGRADRRLADRTALGDCPHLEVVGDDDAAMSIRAEGRADVQWIPADLGASHATKALAPVRDAALVSSTIVQAVGVRAVEDLR